MTGHPALTVPAGVSGNGVPSAFRSRVRVSPMLW